MSTNPKNIIRPAFLKNFTRHVEKRYIVLERSNKQFQDIDMLLSSVNVTMDIIVQNLNLIITDRQIPYINLRACHRGSIEKSVRIFLHNDKTDHCFEREFQCKIQEEELSHIIDILIATGFKRVTVSPMDCDAEIVIDYQLLKCAIIDILLDIAMFNSYSFLKELDISERKDFSLKKYLFYRKKKMNCFYDLSSDKSIYYSISFLARSDEENLECEKYIEYWNEFIELNYPDAVHQEISIENQIKQHVDYKELPKGYYKKFNNLEPGAYLILRTNTDRTESLHPQIYSLFGIKKYRKGKLKIVPVSEYQRCKSLLENLDVSAFKVVKQM